MLHSILRRLAVAPFGAALTLAFAACQVQPEKARTLPHAERNTAIENHAVATLALTSQSLQFFDQVFSTLHRAVSHGSGGKNAYSLLWKIFAQAGIGSTTMSREGGSAFTYQAESRAARELVPGGKMLCQIQGSYVASATTVETVAVILVEGGKEAETFVLFHLDRASAAMILDFTVTSALLARLAGFDEALVAPKVSGELYLAGSKDEILARGKSIEVATDLYRLEIERLEVVGTAESNAIASTDLKAVLITLADSGEAHATIEFSTRDSDQEDLFIRVQASIEPKETP